MTQLRSGLDRDLFNAMETSRRNHAQCATARFLTMLAEPSVLPHFSNTTFGQYGVLPLMLHCMFVWTVCGRTCVYLGRGNIVRTCPTWLRHLAAVNECHKTWDVENSPHQVDLTSTLARSSTGGILFGETLRPVQRQRRPCLLCSGDEEFSNDLRSGRSSSSLLCRMWCWEPSLAPTEPCSSETVPSSAPRSFLQRLRPGPVHATQSQRSPLAGLRAQVGYFSQRCRLRLLRLRQGHEHHGLLSRIHLPFFLQGIHHGGPEGWT